MRMKNLKVTTIQTELYWQDPEKNFSNFDKFLIEGSDVIVMPEMFNTGFAINPIEFAETMEGKSIEYLKNKSKSINSLIITSLMIKENNLFYNRLVCVFPDGTIEYYDKRHLFRLSEESKKLKSGQKDLIVNYLGWKIKPLICYDLRFPIWSKNTVIENNFDYDILVYVANWPATRAYIWKNLIRGRAIENQSYVIGVNRIGKDENNIDYTGDSAIINYDGMMLARSKAKNSTIIRTLDYERLQNFRKEYNFSEDWDNFTIQK